MNFSILDGSGRNFDGRFFDFSSDEDDTLRIDGSGEFVHLFTDFGTLLQ